MQLSLAEAAQRAGVNKTTMLRRIKRGALSGTKTSDGEWRVDAAELSRYLAATATAADAAPNAQRSQRGAHRSAADATMDNAAPDAPVRIGAGSAAPAAEAWARNATLEAEVLALRDRLADMRERLDETKTDRDRRVDELTADRDRWAAQAERLALAPPAPERPAGVLARFLGRAA